MLAWERFQHGWKGLVFAGGSGLSFLPADPSRCHLADFISGAFLVTDPCRNAAIMPTLYSLLAQLGNWLPSLVAGVASSDPSTLPVMPGMQVDKGMIYMWLERLAATGKFSSLPQMLRAIDVPCVSQMCSRVYKEFAQRQLMGIRLEFAKCKKFTIATDKSKAALS